MTRTAAVVGAGTIGLSWAALFASTGMTVRVNDPRPDLAEVVRDGVTQLGDVLPGDLLSLISVEPDLAIAVAGVAVVQENGPERLDLKQELFARIEAAAPPNALLLSSASGLMPSDMAAGMKDPGRLLVGHPWSKWSPAR
ncbi:MAG: hypothetical protein NVS3B26_01890 [Mycobacteriales bacterium]